MAKKKKPKIGLALGMGSARALCHVGVIKVLERVGIEIDYVAGVSMGAFVAALYTMDLGIKRMERICLETDWKRLFSLADFCLPGRGVVRGNKLEEFIKSFIGNAHFSETKIPLAMLATDVESGERKVFKKGPIAKAVHASLSIPVFFKPYELDGKTFMDGGLTDPVPVNLVKEMGADFVIAVSSFVDLKHCFSNDGGAGEVLKEMIGEERYKDVVLDSIDIKKDIRIDVKKFDKRNRKLNMKEAASRSVAIMEEHLALPQLKAADIVITPEVIDVGMLDYTRAKDIITKGEEATLQVLANL
jgi:NTE family protein